MSKRIDKVTRSQNTEYRGRHRFEHWLINNQIYFFTARCRNRFPAFRAEKTKAVFWDRFEFNAKEFGFVPWITSLLDNHYHTLGYLKIGVNLPKMMQRLHGATSKLVNDILPKRHKPFWRDASGKQYFDGCIRDERQAGLAYRYTLIQSERHGLASRWQDYQHTRVNVELEAAIRRSHELGAFLEGVPYKRYLRQPPAR